jgi:oligogalacturonide lyase
MKNTGAMIFAFLLFFSSCKTEKLPVLETGSVTPMPKSWIDKDTHHMITRLTSLDRNNQSFYFHNNPFIPAVPGIDGKMVFYSTGSVNPNDKVANRGIKRQLYTLNLKSLETEQVTDHPTPVMGEIVGKNRREVFYQCGDSVFSTHIETHKTKLIYVFPDSVTGSVTTLNADETILAGVISNRKKMELLRQFPNKSDYFNRIFEAKLPHSLITVEVETGKVSIIHSDTAWLNHVQFSPSDPDLLMFCHEGPWHLLNRIWTINIQTRKVELMHKRTINREIAGHEFFSPDGKTIWFDLQMPRGVTFYLAGLDLVTRIEKHYALKRDEWSIHFNQSPDLKIFAGDGGDSTQVAKAKNGMWIYLFTPGTDSLRSERLVNMKHHNYNLEPNVHFSPDGKKIIFRANFEGLSQVYAVEIKP